MRCEVELQIGCWFFFETGFWLGTLSARCKKCVRVCDAVANSLFVCCVFIFAFIYYIKKRKGTKESLRCYMTCSDTVYRERSWHVSVFFKKRGREGRVVVFGGLVMAERWDWQQQMRRRIHEHVFKKKEKRRNCYRISFQLSMLMETVSSPFPTVTPWNNHKKSKKSGFPPLLLLLLVFLRHIWNTCCFSYQSVSVFFKRVNRRPKLMCLTRSSGRRTRTEGVCCVVYVIATRVARYCFFFTFF